MNNAFRVNTLLHITFITTPSAQHPFRRDGGIWLLKASGWGAGSSEELGGARRRGAQGLTGPCQYGFSCVPLRNMNTHSHRYTTPHTDPLYLTTLMDLPFSSSLNAQEISTNKINPHKSTAPDHRPRVPGSGLKATGWECCQSDRWEGQRSSITDLKPLDLKPLDLKPLDLKPLDLKPLDLKPLDLKPLDLKPLDLKPLDLKPLDLLMSGSLEANDGDWNHQLQEDLDLLLDLTRSTRHADGLFTSGYSKLLGQLSAKDYLESLIAKRVNGEVMEGQLPVKRHSDAVFTDNYSRFRKQMAAKKYLNSVLSGKRRTKASSPPEQGDVGTIRLAPRYTPVLGSSGTGQR
ncbi:unnamed protein product [Lota lota]